ncbi:hypothetical protein Cyrtocomes_00658 [Candidatus Cyrtobacter comes]|uniref:Substrate of the Dot/Icm secretion system n=1 Tax=Candidatus Cyrtobacter comes TaxID=675776 RepID=A0ABU5L8V2_9RICK|nr:hypothetical protein [Candidatus Cyrtobacter comes]MDZ5762279.1 hypothetical protein [Candidatus Cyrtobacter comes]
MARDSITHNARFKKRPDEAKPAKKLDVDDLAEKIGNELLKGKFISKLAGNLARKLEEKNNQVRGSGEKYEVGSEYEFDQHILAAERNYNGLIMLPDHIEEFTKKDIKLTTQIMELFAAFRSVFSNKAIEQARFDDSSLLHRKREDFKTIYGCFSRYIFILQNTTDKTKLDLFYKIIHDGIAELRKCCGNGQFLIYPSQVDYEKFEEAFNSSILEKMQPAVMKAIEKETQENLNKLSGNLKQYLDQISKIDPKVVGFFKTVIFTPLITPIAKAIDIFRAIINIFKHNPKLAQLNDKKIKKLEKVCSALSAFKTKLEEKGLAMSSSQGKNGSDDAPTHTSPKEMNELQNDFRKLKDELNSIQKDAPSLIRAVAQTAVFTMGLPIHALVNFGSYMKSGKPLTDAAFTEFKEKVTEAVGQAHGALHENAADKVLTNARETQPNKIQAIVQKREGDRSFVGSVKPAKPSVQAK